jgi:hypothetical protein
MINDLVQQSDFPTGDKLTVSGAIGEKSSSSPIISAAEIS